MSDRAKPVRRVFICWPSRVAVATLIMCGVVWGAGLDLHRYHGPELASTDYDNLY